MELVLAFWDILPVFFVAGNVVAASTAKKDISAIKYLLWAILWSMLPVVDFVMNQA